MMVSRILIGIIIAAIIAFAAPASAQQGEGCVTAKCHAEIGTKKWVHGPVGSGNCMICHAVADAKNHKFVFTAEKEELCFGCHETTRDMMLQTHLHTPVAKGNCIGCHDPHQSDFQFSLKGKAADLCYNCHKKDAFTMNFVHGPVGVGDCNACHNPHSSPNVNQLVAPPEQICAMCHKEKAGIKQMRHVHKPVAEKCENCHSPHSSAAKYLLPSDPPEFCYGCHQNIEKDTQSAYKHQAITDNGCKDCHNSHASDNPRLFPRPQGELCFSCHSELSEYVSAQQYKHGPVKQGDCNACHNPHGSANYRILRNYFPQEFYKPYAEENYASCFACHNKQVAQDAKTETLTDFRNKDQNLHFLHVNKDVKGRSCKACHQVHASSQQKHIRLSVPFGKIGWELPVKYAKTDNGGSCVVGCHAPKDYSRK